MTLPGIFGNLKPIRERGSTATRTLAPPTPVAGKDLDVAIANQDATNWCWAATALGIARFYTGQAEPQCAFAAKALKVDPDGLCCTNKDDRRCNKQWYLHSALKLVDCFERYEEGPAGFANVKAEVELDRPLGVRVQWTKGKAAGGGHFVAISGWSSDATGGEWVMVRDPWGPASEYYPIRECETAYGADDGKWTHSYFTLKPGTPRMLGGSADPDHRPELLGGG